MEAALRLTCPFLLFQLLGDSPFINETEGVLLVLADGNLGGEAIQNILSGFGELRSFSHANLPNKQVSEKVVTYSCH